MATQAKALLKVQTLEDVAELLVVSPKQLRYLLYVRKPHARYRTFDLPKRRGGVRTIRAPRRELKYIQRNLAAQLDEVYLPWRAVHGFLHGKSIVSNAKMHCPVRNIFNVDLKDFFPSINFGRVRGLFLHPPFSLQPKVATVLAQICCHDDMLPQGAPTSPVLSNMICCRMDGALTRLAKRHRCRYSRYADDLTFSHRTAEIPPEIGFANETGAYVGTQLHEIICENGFRINQGKVHLQGNRCRQRVTGLIVNKKPNVPRRFVRQIRAMIHAWDAYGEEAANEQHASLYYRRAAAASEPPQLSAVIRGKLDFIKMVKGVRDSVYRNLQKQFVGVHPDYLAVLRKENDHMSSRDVFIAHASEDKDLIAKPLADALVAAGYTVWYDEYEVKLGDSLLQKINEGLLNSRYGVVILSRHFFSKKWPQKELDGLTALELADGSKRILPVWHQLSFQELAKYSPMLAGIKAADTARDDIPAIVSQIALVL